MGRETSTVHSISASQEGKKLTKAKEWLSRVLPKFFDQVRHEIMYASSGNKHFCTKSCHRQTYQNYEQS